MLSRAGESPRQTPVSFRSCRANQTTSQTRSGDVFVAVSPNLNRRDLQDFRDCCPEILWRIWREPLKFPRIEQPLAPAHYEPIESIQSPGSDILFASRSSPRSLPVPCRLVFRTTELSSPQLFTVLLSRVLDSLTEYILNALFRCTHDI